MSSRHCYNLAMSQGAEGAELEICLGRKIWNLWNGLKQGAEIKERLCLYGGVCLHGAPIES